MGVNKEIKISLVRIELTSIDYQSISLPLRYRLWSRIYLKIIKPDQVPLTEPYFNLQQVTCKQT